MSAQQGPLLLFNLVKDRQFWLKWPSYHENYTHPECDQLTIPIRMVNIYIGNIQGIGPRLKVCIYFFTVSPKLKVMGCMAALQCTVS